MNEAGKKNKNKNELFIFIPFGLRTCLYKYADMYGKQYVPHCIPLEIIRMYNDIIDQHSRAKCGDLHRFE